MTFQFQCPNGHLLAAEESQAGQQCLCPTCTILFIIPAPLAPVAPYDFPTPPPTDVPGPSPATTPFPAIDVFSARRAPRTADILLPPEPDEAEAASAPAPPEPVPQVFSREPELFHIPCPQGHMLEAPAEMLDQEVLCPTCQTPFHLRRQDSEEQKRKRRAEIARQEERKGQIWIVLAAIVVALVLLGLLYLIAQSSGG